MRTFAASRRAWIALLVAGCAAAPQAPELDPGLAALALGEVHPGLLLPGSSLDLVGASFVDADRGLLLVHLGGTFTPASGAPAAVDVQLPAGYRDENHASVPPAFQVFAALGGAPGNFVGKAYLEVDSAIDQQRHLTPPIDVALALATTLTPTLQPLHGGPIFVNQTIALDGSGFLLGGGEGETGALLNGCFLPAGRAQPCARNGVRVTNVEVPASPAAPWDRAHARFPFSPSVAGIHPGSFSGTVALRNRIAGGPLSTSSAQPLAVTIQKPALTTFSPTAASLGQYVDIRGGGFVGGAPGEVTLVHLVGQFTPEGKNTHLPVDLYLLPAFVAGDHLRYVLDEADDLGHHIDLRNAAGSFAGTAQPVVRAGQEEELGAATAAALGLAHVKQVIYLRYLDSYVESLRRYGLRLADGPVRDRILAVARRDYAGVNLEWRDAPPSDFALYSQVDILGPDPNGLGLFGYDNTPGKDVGNARLFDRVGGVNATTQQDGFPGYGGIFAEQFLGFSQHPPAAMARLPFQTAYFDPIFDPLRPDAGGVPASALEVAAAPVLTDGSPCPAKDRPTQVACAIFVLGDLIGTTLTHETGHSLGLANPYGDGFHDVGDLPNRLMEAGADRPFEERAELLGQGPGRFCDTELTYLQTILPAPPGSDPHVTRPPCTN